MDLSHYQAIREGAGLVERVDRGRLLLTGRDRASYLQGLLTNDIKALAPGHGCYAAYLTAQGRMITDVRVFEVGQGLLLALPLHVTSGLRDRLERLVFTEDVQVADVTVEWHAFGLYGRAAAGVLAAAARGVADATLADRLAALRPFQHERHEVAGSSVVIAASDEVGVAGFDLFGPRPHAPSLRAALVATGAVPVEPETLEVVRIESGVPAFGADMDEETSPLEAGIEDRAISFTKGCFVGQEVIVRVRDRGHGRVGRRLVGLLVEGDVAPGRADHVTSGGREVGRVTSAVVSPALGRPIALGYVYRDFADPGTRVVLAHGDRRLDAAVAALPFVTAT